jgi:hypothetical protein
VHLIGVVCSSSLNDEAGFCFHFFSLLHGNFCFSLSLPVFSSTSMNAWLAFGGSQSGKSGDTTNLFFMVSFLWLARSSFLDMDGIFMSA